MIFFTSSWNLITSKLCINPTFSAPVYKIQICYSITEPLRPTLNDLPHQLNVFAGSKANFTCQASGTPRPTITWFKNGHRVPRSFVKGVKGHSILTFAPVRRDDEGEYWCEAKSSAGWNRSSTATLTGW